MHKIKSETSIGLCPIIGRRLPLFPIWTPPQNSSQTVVGDTVVADAAVRAPVAAAA